MEEMNCLEKLPIKPINNSLETHRKINEIISLLNVNTFITNERKKEVLGVLDEVKKKDTIIHDKISKMLNDIFADAIINRIDDLDAKLYETDERLGNKVYENIVKLANLEESVRTLEDKLAALENTKQTREDDTNV